MSPQKQQYVAQKSKKTTGDLYFYQSHASAIEDQSIQLYPGALCETFAGDIAYVVGRVALMKGRPLLVEHVGGIFLIHNFKGQVISSGYDQAYNISVVLPQMSEMDLS